MNDELYPPTIDRLEPTSEYKENKHHLDTVDLYHCVNVVIGSLIQDATCSYAGNRRDAVETMTSIAGRLNQLAIKYKALNTQRLEQDKQQIEKELKVNNG